MPRTGGPALGRGGRLCPGSLPELHVVPCSGCPHGHPGVAIIVSTREAQTLLPRGPVAQRGLAGWPVSVTLSTAS